MENNGRRLGWIAIAIGVVALLVALTGRVSSFGWSRYNQFGPQPQFAQPYQNNPNVAPQAPAAPQGRMGPRGNIGPNMRGEGPGFHGGPMHMRGGPGWFGFFMWPFRLVGGLFKLLFWGLLIFLVIKLFQRRGWGGPRGGGRGPDGPRNEPTQPNQSTPPSEQPPYTGETQSF